MNLFQKAMSYVFGVQKIGFPADPGPRSYSGLPVNEDSVLGLSVGWACVNLHAGLVASTPFKMYVPNGRGGFKEINDHALAHVLAVSPNADQDPFMFWEGGQARLELRGSMHAEIETSRAGIVALTPINNASCTRQSDGSLLYTWSENGRQRREGADKVFHVRGFGGSPLGGLSTLAYGAQIFGLNSAINIAAQSTFRNGARPGGAVSFDKFLTAPQREQLETSFNEKYVGALNAGRPFLLEGGATWHDISFTPEDAQMLQSRGFGVEEGCRMFGVPPFMIGHNEKASGYPSSLEQQILMFSRFHFAKRLRRIEMAACKQLLTTRDRALGVTVKADMDELQRGDSVGRAQFYQTMTNIGALTINEVRAKEHLPPVEGGEVPRMQMQNVPISEPLRPKPVSGGN